MPSPHGLRRLCVFGGGGRVRVGAPANGITISGQSVHACMCACA
jgi:hypothetical protein